MLESDGNRNRIIAQIGAGIGAHIGRLDRSWRRADGTPAPAGGAALHWVRRPARRRGAPGESLRAEVRFFPSPTAAEYDLERWLASRWRGAEAWQPTACPWLGEAVWLADHRIPGLPARVELARAGVRATVLAESADLAVAAARQLLAAL